MKYKLMKYNDELHLLFFTGNIQILTMDEARRYVFDFDSVELPEGADMSHIFNDYEGELLVSLEDNGNLTVYNSRFIRELAMPSEFPYFSVPEYAAAHEKKGSIIRRLCGEGRIEGAVQIGATWLIPKNAPYPDDRRAGRDMSKRYQRKTEILTE